MSLYPENDEERISTLNDKRQKYVNEQTALLTKLGDEILSCKNEMEAIGFAIFGEKANQKKQLKAKIHNAEREIERVRPILKQICNRKKVINEIYSHMISGRCFFLTLLKKDQTLRIVYNDKDNCYEVLFPVKGGFSTILQLESFFTLRYGPYREFSAVLNAHTEYYENDDVSESWISYCITSID